MTHSKSLMSETDLIGDAFDTPRNIAIDMIAHADVRFFKQRDVADFSVGWVETYRDLRELLT